LGVEAVIGKRYEFVLQIWRIIRWKGARPQNEVGDPVSNVAVRKQLVFLDHGGKNSFVKPSLSLFLLLLVLPGKKEPSASHKPIAEIVS
jgi:hypothetical protein